MAEGIAGSPERCAWLVWPKRAAFSEQCQPCCFSCIWIGLQPQTTWIGIGLAKEQIRIAGVHLDGVLTDVHLSAGSHEAMELDGLIAVGSIRYAFLPGAGYEDGTQRGRSQHRASTSGQTEGLTDDDGARAALVQGCCWCIRAIRSIIFMQLWIVTEQAPPITQGSTG